MELTTAQLIITAIGLIMGGGGIGAIMQVWLGRAKISQEQRVHDQNYIQRGFQLAVDVVTNQRDDALEENKELRKRLDNLELEIVGLKLASGFDPFPRWMVDLEGKYLYVNTCFEERFVHVRGMRRPDIIGKGHEVLWPPTICKKFKELDALARTRPDGRARAVTTLTLDGADSEVTIYKFPVKVHGVIVAYAGYLMEM